MIMKKNRIEKKNGKEKGSVSTDNMKFVMSL